MAYAVKESKTNPKDSGNTRNSTKMDRTKPQAMATKKAEMGSKQIPGAVHPAKEAGLPPGHNKERLTSSGQKLTCSRSGKAPLAAWRNGPSSKTGGGVVAGRGESEAC